MVARSAALLVLLPAGLAAAPLRPWCGASRLNAAERTICATPELARLDTRLADLYGALRSADPDQDRWLVRRRDGCGADIACLRAAYTERLRSLAATGRGN